MFISRLDILTRCWWKKNNRRKRHCDTEFHNRHQRLTIWKKHVSLFMIYVVWKLSLIGLQHKIKCNPSIFSTKSDTGLIFVTILFSTALKNQNEWSSLSEDVPFPHLSTSTGRLDQLLDYVSILSKHFNQNNVSVWICSICIQYTMRRVTQKR